MSGPKDPQVVGPDWDPVEPLGIDGVTAKQITNVLTNDGYLTEIWRADWALDECGVGQVFQRVIEAGGVSGWHAHALTVDRLFCAYGRVRLGLYDGRNESPTREMVDRGCRFDVGTTVRFSAGEPGTRLLAAGWSRPDADGVWNDDDAAELLLDVGGATTDGLELHLVLRPFHAGTDIDADRRADVYVADELVESVSLDDRFRPALRLPLRPPAFRGSRVGVRFEFSNSLSPESLGQSPDTRRLSLGLVTATLDRCSPQGERRPRTTGQLAAPSDV